MAKRMTGAKVIETPRNEIEGWLVQTVKRQAERAGIGMPEVAIYDAPDANAFATGMRRDAALVAVSTGLLRGMNRDEVEAVLAHEVSHVANGDMVTLALIQGVVNTFVIVISRVVGHLVDRVVFKTERGHGPAFYITSILAQIVFGILASTIVLYFSRQREFRADAGGADLAGREKMVAALDKLRRNSTQPHLPDQMAAFGISGNVSSGIKRLFMTHPPLEERIAALRGAVEPGEWRPLFWSFSYFFALLCGYYIIRPMRDEMGIAGGVEHLQWMFSGTFVVMLAAVPLFGWIARRYPPRRFRALCLLLLYRPPAAVFRSVQIRSGPCPRGAGFFHLGQRLQSLHRLRLLEFHGGYLLQCPGQAAVRGDRRRRHDRRFDRSGADGRPGVAPGADQSAVVFGGLSGLGGILRPPTFRLAATHRPRTHTDVRKTPDRRLPPRRL
jgi:heat shock protein HtpX